MSIQPIYHEIKGRRHAEALQLLAVVYLVVGCGVMCHHPPAFVDRLRFERFPKLVMLTYT